MQLRTMHGWRPSILSGWQQQGGPQWVAAKHPRLVGQQACLVSGTRPPLCR